MTNHTLANRLYESLGTIISTAKPGDRLPSEPDLARQLGVSRATLRETMRTYENQGLIQRQQGVGTFVLRPMNVIESGLEVLESIESMAQRTGLVVSLGRLKIENRAASEHEALVLGIEPGREVTRVSRVILAEGVPAAYLIDILPSEYLDQEELRKSFTGSVLDLLIKTGKPPLMCSRCEISAITARQESARELDIPQGTALLCFTSRMYSNDGGVVGYSFSYFIPEYFRFHIVRELDKKVNSYK